MTNGDKPHSFLMENIITLLCHDDEHGKIISNLVTPDLFEGDYKLLAERVLNYWKQHNQAPKVHVYDLLGDIFSDPINRQGSTFRRILQGMAQLHPSVNAKYILTSVRDFTRLQKFKHTTIRVADIMQRNQELAIPEVEELWYEILKSRELAFDAGSDLIDFEDVLNYLEHSSSEFQTSVHELNKNHINPGRGYVLLLIAPRGEGKTWYAIDVGKNALRFRKKVVHLTLEVSVQEVKLRYYQSLFGVPKRKCPYIEITTFKYEKPQGLNKYNEEKLIGFGKEKIIPEFTFNSDNIREELEARRQYMFEMFKNIKIKQFPMRSLTMQGLEAYLDNLEMNERFIPDMLILDYIGITKTKVDNHTIELGRNLEDFIGICQRRNLAGVTMNQTNRKGAQSINVRDTEGSEAFSMSFSAHNVLTLSRTPAEKKHNLARIFVNKGRSEADGQTILISQCYNLGQFCTNSIIMDTDIIDKVNNYVDNKDEEESYDRDDE
jgi:hypothetical protein